MTELIHGKVAEIINERSLAINRGKEHGVRTGMHFLVLGPPADVKDPESGEVLVRLEREKVRVRATQVGAKYAICETYSATEWGAGFISVGSAGLLGSPPPTLRTRDSAYVAPLSPEESYVSIGDDVREIPTSAAPAPAKKSE
jgi:hypothetical protein